MRIWRRGQKRGRTFCSYVLTSLPKKRSQPRDSVYWACTSLRLIFLPQAPGAWTRVTDMHYHAWLIKCISLDTVGKWYVESRRAGCWELWGKSPLESLWKCWPAVTAQQEELGRGCYCLQTKLPAHRGLSLASFPKAAPETVPLCHPLIKLYGAISSFPSQLFLSPSSCPDYPAVAHSLMEKGRERTQSANSCEFYWHCRKHLDVLDNSVILL